MLSSHFSFFFCFLQINRCHSWLSCFKRRGTHARRATHLPRCLFICMIISSCTKEQQQDIWCNTIAGSVPRGAPSALCSKTTGVFNSAVAFVRSVAPSATLASRRARSAASRGCLCVQATGFIPTVSNSGAGVSLSESRLHAVEELAPSGDTSHCGLFGWCELW